MFLKGKVIICSTKFANEKPVISNLRLSNSVLNLPHECLMAFYESRRRWIFGGTGLSCVGLAVEGVHNSGSNVHRVKAKRSLMDEPLLSLAGVGVSTLESTPIKNMSEFKGRLLFSRQPIIGYGCNDSTVSAATTAADGSPIWSMADDALPIGFFDPKTAQFNDSLENRIKAKLSINFGNPYKTKKGDSIIPENWTAQRPSFRRKISDTDSNLGSPPHGKYETRFSSMLISFFPHFFSVSPTQILSQELSKVRARQNL